jgi:hypothetical protein
MKMLMTLVIAAMFVPVCWAAEFEAENEVVTSKEFDAHQKKMKAKEKKLKVPPILSSAEYLARPKSFLGKRYRVRMQSDDINMKPVGRGGCEILYFVHGVEDMSGYGDGTYSFESDKPQICYEIAKALEGLGGDGGDLIVEMSNVAKYAAANGTLFVVPEFTIVKTGW